MKLLKYIGIFLLVFGIIYVIVNFQHINSNSTKISLPGNIKGFSNLKIADEQNVKKALAIAEKAMNENVTSYKNWSSISVFASWAAFLFGGIITLLAGYLGYMKTDAVSLESLQSSIKDKVKLSKIVGLLAAGATLMTGFSVKAKEEAEQKRTKGIEIRDIIIGSYKDIQQAKPDEVTLIIEKLKLQSSF